MGALRMDLDIQFNLMILKTHVQPFYPILASYICIYECVHVVLTDVGHDIILSLSLSYMTLLLPLTILGCYIIS